MRLMHSLRTLSAIAVAWVVVGCGGGGGAGTTPPPPTTPARLELFAGEVGGDGNLDGPGSLARFGSNLDIAADSSGNLYVADAGNLTVRRIDAAGNVSTLAGSGVRGTADGTSREASFFYIRGIAVDPANNVYVADTGNKNIRKISPAGVVTTLAGSGATGSVDGEGSAAQFLGPSSVAADAQGNVYVADGSAIRKVTPGGVVTTFAGAGRESAFRDGRGTAARFVAPVSLGIDSAGRLYVTDNNTVRLVSHGGDVTTIAGRPGVSGSVDGVGTNATFNFLMDIAVDAQGNALVLDLGANGITVRQVTPAGVVVTVARLPGFGLTALASRAAGVVIAASTVVYAMGPDSTLSPIAGTARTFEAVDGDGAAARFRAITGMALDATGSLRVAESFPPALRRITPDAKVTTVANLPSSLQPRMIVADDRAGNTYLGNADCPRGFCLGTVSRLTGNALTVIAGSLPGGQSLTPSGLAADALGNVYVADGFYCTVYRIRAPGAVEVLAGESRYMCGASDAAAVFTRLGALALAASGDLYLVDGHAIRRLDASGIVTTIAGKPGEPGNADGDGAAARFRDPSGIALDDGGNVYVADNGNSVVRKIAPTGVVTTVAGVAGVVGFVPGPLPGVLDRPVAVAVVGKDLFIAMDRSIAVIHDRP
jgi:sugar lactone lactonase YvrE